MSYWFRLGFLLPLSMPILVVAGTYAGAWYLAPIIVFGAVPLLDRWLGDETRNPTAGESKSLNEDPYFTWILYLYAPMHFALILWAVWYVNGAHWVSVLTIGFAVGVVTGGIGITVAHELGHRRPVKDRVLSCALLASVSYMHFYVEHNKGHHGRVATPDDPASARFGETLYAFLPRTLWGSYTSAWEIEVERLARQKLSVFSPRNLMLWATAIPITLGVVFLLLFGLQSLLVFLVQSVIAILLLETVNYIEHYGLQRDQDSSGRYEKVNHTHSWNSNRRLTSLFLFNLQRHSHHHANVTKKYQTLEWFEDSPQLPCGYSELVLLAWVPPMWRNRIHPLIG